LKVNFKPQVRVWYLCKPPLTRRVPANRCFPAETDFEPAQSRINDSPANVSGSQREISDDEDWMEGRLANARVISVADVPKRPVSPNKPRNLILSTILGLMLALALAALADRMDDRVHSEEDAESASRLPVLAHIPFIQEKAKQSLINNTDQTSSLLESYRMLRTNIEFAAVGEPIRSIVVTSSQPNEGKSTTSVDLAIVMALDGRKVILVDADLRRPSSHKLLGLSNKFGFTSVVAGTRTLEDALQDTTTPNLRVLTSGPTPPNPPEFLNSKAARSLLREIRDMADIVIIDTPPGLVMADAQIALRSRMPLCS
jgi:receptor protein-tyrosine kinase